MTIASVVTPVVRSRLAVCHAVRRIPMGRITNKRLKPVQPRPKSNSHPPLTTAGGRLGVGRFVTSPVDWFKITLVRRATRAADLASSSPRPLPESVQAASRPVHLPDPAVPTDPQTPASRWTVTAARRACGWLRWPSPPLQQPIAGARLPRQGAAVR